MADSFFESMGVIWSWNLSYLNWNISFESLNQNLKFWLQQRLLVKIPMQRSRPVKISNSGIFDSRFWLSWTFPILNSDRERLCVMLVLLLGAFLNNICVWDNHIDSYSVKMSINIVIDYLLVKEKSTWVSDSHYFLYFKFHNNTFDL